MNPLLDPPAWTGDTVYRVLARTGTERGLRWLRSVVWALFVAGCLAFLVRGADGPANPYLSNHMLPGYAPPKTTPAPPTTLSHP